jgi:hypothetical protein
MSVDFDADDEDADYYDPANRHEICDRCGDQMWWDEAGTDWRCSTCETEYE